jgi:alcohol dehydrogenase class IV
MMRPMKLAGSQLLFGQGCLEHIKSLTAKRVMIVIGGSTMEKNQMLAKVQHNFESIGAQVEVLRGVEPDPSFSTVQRGALAMVKFQPDLIVALGGGSVMDGAKAMWIYYEHPELETLDSIMPPNEFPKLREKAIFCCIPSTSGTASEVSRSIVITDDATGLKYGLGNMEMMPDIAICDPEVTVSMPKKITAETGMDALTHALEALASTRANYVSDVLAYQAAEDIITHLPEAYQNGENLEARELMLNASMIAGMAFTNVSLGIVHSMAHILGGVYKIPHGLADAILLPYVIEFNSADARARGIYEKVANKLDEKKLSEIVRTLNDKLGIPQSLSELVKEEEFLAKVDYLTEHALLDGCTKTNPIIPTHEELKSLFIKAYRGE